VGAKRDNPGIVIRHACGGGKALLLAGVSLAMLASAGCRKAEVPEQGASAAKLRIGFFPNITHAAALAGLHETTTRGPTGWFETRTGAKIEWLAFNAGPSAIEALLAGTVDLTYVGPRPVINGYTRTGSADIRVLSGAARGGAALVIPRDSSINTAAGFKGKRMATPQLGNTQDVSARDWLRSGGLIVRPTGGDVHVVPTANPDQLALFQRGQLDGVWTVEPWVSRLELEANGKILVEETNILAAVVATSIKTLARKPELTRKFLAAHGEMIDKIAKDPAWAKPAVNAALAKATTRPIPTALLDRAWGRITFSTDVQLADFQVMQRQAKASDLLPREVDLAKLIHRP
jgi:NitT/TauT family transport system substrate-binding protein